MDNHNLPHQSQDLCTELPPSYSQDSCRGAMRDSTNRITIDEYFYEQNMNEMDEEMANDQICHSLPINDIFSNAAFREEVYQETGEEWFSNNDLRGEWLKAAREKQLNSTDIREEMFDHEPAAEELFNGTSLSDTDLGDLFHNTRTQLAPLTTSESITDPNIHDTDLNCFFRSPGLEPISSFDDWNSMAETNTTWCGFCDQNSMIVEDGQRRCRLCSRSTDSWHWLVDPLYTHPLDDGYRYPSSSTLGMGFAEPAHVHGVRERCIEESAHSILSPEMENFLPQVDEEGNQRLAADMQQLRIDNRPPRGE